MSDAISPDLPTPGQAVEDAKAILKESKNAFRQRLLNEEFMVKQPTEKHEAPKYTPDEAWCQKVVKRLNRLKRDVEEKLKNDVQVREIASAKPAGADQVEKVIERIIETADGRIIYQLDIGGETSGTLHIVYNKSITSESGAQDIVPIENISIDESGILIDRVIIEDDIEETHSISTDEPEENEVDENTPQAVQRAEELMNLYLKA